MRGVEYVHQYYLVLHLVLSQILRRLVHYYYDKRCCSCSVLLLYVRTEYCRHRCDLRLVERL